MLISRSVSFYHMGFTYVIPRDGFVYKILGKHVHEDVIKLIKSGSIPLAYLKTKMPAGDHQSQKLFVDVFHNEVSICHT